MRSVRAAALVVFLAPAFAAAQAPWETWKTIETSHFRVHYPEPFEAWARHAASSVEAIHARVADFVGYAPPKRVEIVIGDPQADANGSALPLLDRPVVVLWAYPPDSESGLGDYTDWMDLVVTHEFAHIAHLTRPRNRPGLLEKILPFPIGPIAIASPRWVDEGYATLVEGALTGSGRPNSAFRAMVLRRFAIEGKLPSYGALSRTSGWIGGSMAYLVGSSYLEWLEQREGGGALVRLWKRLASRRGGGFGTAFRGVFGESPDDLYDRFRADVTAAAVEDEKATSQAGVVDGELWQRLRGATGSPQVSRDGQRVLAFRAPQPGRGRLVVWSVPATAADLRAEERRRKAEADLVRDPNEVADRPEEPRPRQPVSTLLRWNGASPENPRWMPDGRRVLFSRRVPDAEGVRRRDLFLWDTRDGRVARVTRFADVEEADPSPDGRAAVGVRNRHGISELVRVDLETGIVSPIVAGPPAGSAWRVWSHARLSPDGRTIAVLVHENARWRLVALPEAGGTRRVVAESCVGPPSWSADGSRLYFGTDATGRWEIASASVDAASRIDSAAAAPATLTRVTGGAFSPAPSPDGTSLFFLEWTARGLDLRRLSLPASSLENRPREAPQSPVLAPLSTQPVAFPEAEAAPPRPYRALETQVVRTASGFSLGPSGNSWEVGVEGADVVGRLDWVALAAFGNAAGPRGGAVAAAWSGLPAKITIQLFSSLERPGSQRLAPRADLDEHRFGAAADAQWRRPFDGGSIRAELGGGWTRIETDRPDDDFSRALVAARGTGTWRRTRGQVGYELAAGIRGVAGETDGGFWRQILAEGRLTGIAPFGTLSVSGRYGDTGGSPSRFDRFWIGGVTTSLQAPVLDANRIASPAVPAALQTGGRLETYRADLTLGALPLVFFGEGLRAWDASGAAPRAVRVAGVELRLERLVPLDVSDSLSLHVGVARVESSQPRLRTTQGYGGLIFRP